MIVMLALSDTGAPAVAGFGISAFAFSPDRFSELIAAAIERGGLVKWASNEEAATIR
jgi:hypothetical protein